jgi:hypothetical protein
MTPLLGKMRKTWHLPTRRRAFGCIGSPHGIVPIAAQNAMLARPAASTNTLTQRFDLAKETDILFQDAPNAFWNLECSTFRVC